MLKRNKLILLFVTILVLIIVGNFLYSYQYFIKRNQIFLYKYEYFSAILDFAKSEYSVRNGEDSAVYIIKSDVIVREGRQVVDNQFVFDTEEYELDMESELGKALSEIYENYEVIPSFRIYFDEAGNIAMKIPILWEENEKRLETRQYSILYVDELFDSSDYPENGWMRCGMYSDEKTDYKGKKYWYNWEQDYPWG